MKGNPKFNVGDIVNFTIKINKKTHNLKGYIYIIDPYGTFEQPDEVSYDIMCPERNCLYKHISESDDIKLVLKSPIICNKCVDKEFIPTLFEYLSKQEKTSDVEYLLNYTKDILEYQNFCN